MTINFKEIDLTLIDTEGQSVREAQDDDHVVELSMSIAKHGLLEPIVVQQKDNGRYQLLAGFHRLAAFHKLRQPYIPAHIKEENTAPIKGIALIENIVRRDMSINEEVLAVAYLNTDEHLSPSQICDLLGKSRAWVDRRLAIPNYPDDVRRELFDANLEIGKADIIARIKDDGTRALVLNQVISAKLTTKQTDDLVTLYMESSTIQDAIEAGLETAREIQASPIPTRRCDIGAEICRLEQITFLAVCPSCLTEINNALVQQSMKED